MTTNEPNNDTRSGTAPFKVCTACGYVWRTREEFLGDPAVALAGYQVDFERLEMGLLLFNHRACRSTLALPAQAFRDLYDGPIYEPRAFGTASCPGYCVHRDELRSCPAVCECAFVREILQIVRNWAKGGMTNDE